MAHLDLALFKTDNKNALLAFLLPYALNTHSGIEAFSPDDGQWHLGMGGGREGRGGREERQRN